MPCGINDFKISLKCVSCEINGRSRGSGGTFFTDFSEVSCAGALLSNLAPFFFSPPTSFFWISPPTPIPTLSTFFFFATCHLFPYTTLLQEWKARITIPFTFAPFVLAQSRKKEKKRKKPCNQCKQAGQTCGRTCVRVYVRNMFLDNMLMCCESACSSENNLLIRRVLFVGAYMLTSAKCMVSWFKTTVFKSAQNVKEEMNLLELDFSLKILEMWNNKHPRNFSWHKIFISLCWTLKNHDKLDWSLWRCKRLHNTLLLAGNPRFYSVFYTRCQSCVSVSQSNLRNFDFQTDKPPGLSESTDGKKKDFWNKRQMDFKQLDLRSVLVTGTSTKYPR